MTYTHRVVAPILADPSRTLGGGPATDASYLGLHWTAQETRRLAQGRLILGHFDPPTPLLVSQLDGPRCPGHFIRHRVLAFFG